MINAGFNGATVADVLHGDAKQGWPSFEQQLKKHQPTIVMLLIGINNVDVELTFSEQSAFSVRCIKQNRGMQTE